MSFEDQEYRSLIRELAAVHHEIASRAKARRAEPVTTLSYNADFDPVVDRHRDVVRRLRAYVEARDRMAAAAEVGVPH